MIEINTKSPVNTTPLNFLKPNTTLRKTKLNTNNYIQEKFRVRSIEFSRIENALRFFSVPPNTGKKDWEDYWLKASPNPSKPDSLEIYEAMLTIAVTSNSLTKALVFEVLSAAYHQTTTFRDAVMATGTESIKFLAHKQHFGLDIPVGHGQPDDWYVEAIYTLRGHTPEKVVKEVPVVEQIVTSDYTEEQKATFKKIYERADIKKLLLMFIQTSDGSLLPVDITPEQFIQNIFLTFIQKCRFT